jgi:hypothetical protein
VFQFLLAETFRAIPLAVGAIPLAVGPTDSGMSHERKTSMIDAHFVVASGETTQRSQGTDAIPGTRT